MDPIRLIRDQADLQGTCDFELLPGEYRGRCWNEGSVFLAEDVFGLIEPVIERHEPKFNHYSFVGIHRSTWERIISDLEQLAERAGNVGGISDLRGEVGFLFRPTEDEFAGDFRANVEALTGMVRELVGWLREQLRRQEYVSILGI
jgi:hypothetical protein